MKLIALVLPALCLVGCATVTSVSTPVKPEGVLYYLPKRLHKVTVSVTNSTGDIAKLKKAEKKYADALSAMKAPSEDYKNKEDASNKADEIAKKTPDGPAKDKAKAESEAAKTLYDLSKMALGKATAAVNDAYDELNKIKVAPPSDEGVCNYVATLAIEPQALIPDSNFKYAAEIGHNWFHSDEMKITTTDSGLLSSTDSKSVDNTGDIISKITQAIASFGVSVPSFLKSDFRIMGKAIEKKMCLESFTLSEIVDLSNEEQIGSMNLTLNSKLGMSLYVYDPSILLTKPVNDEHNKSEIEKQQNPCKKCEEEHTKIPPLKAALEAKQKKTLNAKPAHPGCGEKNDGLFYRRDLPYLVTLLYSTENVETVVANALVSMPNLSPTSLLAFDPAYFVTNTQKVGFNNGLLVSLETTKPSEVMGFVSIPADIIKSYIGAVTQLIQLRLDYTNKETDLAKSQAALIDAVKALKDKQQAAQSATQTTTP